MNLQEVLLRAKQIFGRKNIVFPILIFASVIIIFALFLFLYNLLNPSLNTQNLSDYSKTILRKATNYFIIQKDKGYIYKSSKTGIDVVKDFINKNPSFKGVKLLPSDFAENSDLIRSKKDSEDKFLKSKNINITNEHYIFEQKINEIPIYGSSLAVHLRNKNEIYSVSGNLVKTKITTEQKITEDEARQVALNDALKEVPGTTQFKIIKSQKYILNKKVLGLSNDEVNYLALGIQVDSSDKPPTFSVLYFIDLETGEILHKLSNIMDFLDRQIYSCLGSSCSLVRDEGEPPVGDNDADNAYDYFGDIYNYYFNNFQRDSYDDAGAALNGYVHAPVENAQWDGIQMSFRTGMVIKDVTAHELTHGVTQYTAGLIYRNQSGALNESISDIFGSNLDLNWTMGEGSILGIIRDMSNPPARNDPDRLFSSLYQCNGSPSNCGDFNDNCGVHANSGVMNKAFYLITDGGNFNGCSVTGVGRDKSAMVVYQALTRYLTSTSNFKSMYGSMLSACNDLYTSGSSDCENIKRALQATEMDQQPDGDQAGALCQNIPPQTPQCAGGAPLPTDSVTPTVTSVPGSSPTPTITSAPARYTINIHVYNDNNNNENEDGGDTPYQGASVNLTGPVSKNGITSASGDLPFSNLPTGNYSLTFIIPGYTIAPYPLTITNGDVRLVLRLPPIASLTPPIIITQPIIPTPTLTPSPTPPGGGSGGTSPTPSPTPIVFFNCHIDPSCVTGQKNLQFCPLICTQR